MAGYDDVLLTDRHGSVAEGSTWNVGFFDGDRVVWPTAPALLGITMQLLREGLRAVGVESVSRDVSREELPGFRGAFASNSISPARPIAGVDATAYPGDRTLIDLLTEAYLAAPWQLVTA
jgi:4-amino-4-deoxychorismate lyase